MAGKKNLKVHKEPLSKKLNLLDHVFKAHSAYFLTATHFQLAILLPSVAGLRPSLPRDCSMDSLTPLPSSALCPCQVRTVFRLVFSTCSDVLQFQVVSELHPEMQLIPASSRTPARLLLVASLVRWRLGQWAGPRSQLQFLPRS